MAFNRSFGQEISGNRRRGGELSSEMRAVIQSKLQDNQKPGKITAALNISRNTVYYTKKKMGPIPYHGLDTPERPAPETYTF